MNSSTGYTKGERRHMGRADFADFLEIPLCSFGNGARSNPDWGEVGTVPS